MDRKVKMTKKIDEKKTIYSKALHKLNKLMMGKTKGDFNIYRLDHTASSMEVKNVGKGKNKQMMLQMKINIPVDSLFKDDFKGARNDLRHITGIDFLGKNEHLKAFPILVMVDNLEQNL